MIRSSNRKIAGSRFNKKVRHHYTTKKEHEGKFPIAEYPVWYQWMADTVNHEARFANIADCFPLAGQRNLKKWKEL